VASKPWVKVWERWWTSRSHADLSLETLAVGLRVMSLTAAAPDQEGTARFCLRPDGKPLSGAALARECRIPGRRLRAAIDELVAVGTLIRREGGAIGFANWDEYQLSPAKRDHQRHGTPRGREYVYFAQAGGPEGLLKIGFSKNPWARVSDMQTSNAERIELLATERGTLDDERALHERFAADRVNGEWFAPSQEIMGYVAGIRSSKTATDPTTNPPTKEDRGQRTEHPSGMSPCSPPRPKRTKPPPSSDSIEIAQYLYDAICEHTPDFSDGMSPARLEHKLTSWARDIDVGLRNDGMTVDGCRQAIDAAHRNSDPFWRPNVLSGTKLRRHYQALRVRKNGRAPDHDEIPFNELRREMDERWPTTK
jgi:hypothetical protein